MSIVVENVSKLYGEQKALNEVSFEISKGEIVGFLGPNGAGKSTLMKIICCYLPASSGKVIIGGQNVQTNELDVKKTIGYLPEHNPLYLDLYVKEFLEFMCGIHGVKNKKERIAEVIQQTGLEVEQHKKIGALSKGYRQRVGIAQAIIHEPQVLILDEPTTGLDPNQIVEIRSLIQEIGKEKTVMLSTHIMQEVEAICERAIIINKGEIVADQQVASLKHLNEQIVFEVEFENLFEITQLELINSVIKVISLGRNKFEIHANTEETRKELSLLALKKNNMIVSLNRQSISLEKVFQKLTK